MVSRHILLVDDDTLMRRSLNFGLQQAGYQAISAESAEDALAIARRDLPDLVLLDIGLPGMDGMEALRYFRDQMGVPVIFLTARRREIDQIVGLELGADDYLTKPINLELLLAHIKAVLRRTDHSEAPMPPASLMTIGDLSIDPDSHTVTLGDHTVDLRPREFALLYALAGQPRRAVPIDELLTAVWGPEFIGESQVVYVHVRWLRQKIEEDPDNPRRVITVPRIGYKFEPQGA